MDSASVIGLALAISEGVERAEGEETRSTLEFPSAKTTHFSGMFDIRNSGAEVFLSEMARRFGITESREPTDGIS